MSDPDRMYELGCHLSALAQSAGATSSVNKLNYTAKAIIDNPQAHIDALVEAGVLLPTAPIHGRAVTDSNGWPTGECEMVHAFYYVAPKPHVHQWKFDPKTSTVMVADLMCNSCPERRTVPNHLPIEVPV